MFNTAFWKASGGVLGTRIAIATLRGPAQAGWDRLGILKDVINGPPLKNS